MPLYEYRCAECGHRFSFILPRYDSPDPQCLKCLSNNVKRLISKFSVIASEDSRIERLADSSVWTDVDENDPKSVARWARRMEKEIGEDLGDEFDELVEKVESGEIDDSSDIDERSSEEESANDEL